MKYKKGFHRHHKIPLNAGGPDDDENLEYLTREEHIEAHQRLYEKYGRDEDRHAVLLLSHGYVRGCKIIHSENCARGARKSHEVKLSRGFYKKLGKLNSERLKGKKNPDLSKHLKQKYQSHKLYWWNNGVDQKRMPESPGPEWSRGRINTGTISESLKSKFNGYKMYWWNDGHTNTRCPSSPGPEWMRGRL